MNRWHQTSETSWMCLYWDVWFQYGAWQAAFIYGRGLNREFRTAREAMRYVDNLTGVSDDSYRMSLSF